MQMIISPAKQMKVDTDSMEVGGLPLFLEDTEQLMRKLQTFSRAELKQLFAANDKITEENFLRYAHMDLRRQLTPAVLSYVGLQYQYMAPQVFSRKQWAYIQSHLWILSGFYGALRPDHGVTPYRLEMQAKLSMGQERDLYGFWDRKLYDAVTAGDKTILNLASKEYSRVIERYLGPEVRFLTCVFGTLQKGKIKVKGTEAKMTRGEMVRWAAEMQIEDPEEVKAFRELGYEYRPEYSTETEYVFLKKEAKREEEAE